MVNTDLGEDELSTASAVWLTGGQSVLTWLPEGSLYEPEPGFLSLSTPAVWGWIILCYGAAVLCMEECLVASLGSTYCAVLNCSVLSDSATPWTVAHQAPLSVGIL